MRIPDRPGWTQRFRSHWPASLGRDDSSRGPATLAGAEAFVATRSLNPAGRDVAGWRRTAIDREPRWIGRSFVINDHGQAVAVRYPLGPVGLQA